jgi:hypothetical protein
MCYSRAGCCSLVCFLVWFAVYCEKEEKKQLTGEKKANKVGA